MNTGLFGGTFDPPHLAHLAVAHAAASFRQLDRVVWIPALIPPHRDAPEATADQRLRMVELATSDHSGFEVSDVELAREGPSYTVSTLALLSEEFPDDSFFLIIGGDSLRSFRTWRSPDRILEFARLIVFDRNPDPTVELDPKLLESVDIIPNTPELDISSSDIRARVKADRSIEHLVPDLVAEYIRAHGLYR